MFFRIKNVIVVFCFFYVILIPEQGYTATLYFQEGNTNESFSPFYDTHAAMVRGNTSSSRNTNYGSISEIGAENETGPGQYTQHSYLKFSYLVGYEEGQIPYGSTIESAYLRVRTSGNSYSGSDNRIYFHRLTGGDWDEASVTWNNYSPSYTSSVGSVIPASNSAYYTINISTAVRDWVAVDPSPNYGLIMRTGGINAGYFFSDDIGTIAYRPRLEINYTAPEQDWLMIHKARTELAQPWTADDLDALYEFQLTATEGDYIDLSNERWYFTPGTSPYYAYGDNWSFTSGYDYIQLNGLLTNQMIPEPMSIMLMGVSLIMMWRRKHRS